MVANVQGFTPADIDTLEDVVTSDWSVRLDEDSTPGGGIGNIVQGLDDVEQCIRIVVTTPLGSDPLRPDFGCDIFGFLDRPLTTFRAHAVRAITDALRRWEPRCIVTSVLVDPSAQAAGRVKITIVWRLDLSAPVIDRSTTLSLTRQ